MERKSIFSMDSINKIIPIHRQVKTNMLCPSANISSDAMTEWMRVFASRSLHPDTLTSFSYFFFSFLWKEIPGVLSTEVSLKLQKVETPDDGTLLDTLRWQKDQYNYYHRSKIKSCGCGNHQQSEFYLLAFLFVSYQQVLANLLGISTTCNYSWMCTWLMTVTGVTYILSSCLLTSSSFS